MNKDNLIHLLEKNKFSFKIFEHEPVQTVKESLYIDQMIEGAHTKNLFLKSKKNKFYLISCLSSTKVDLKILSKKMNAGNLSFANHIHLKNLLGVKPGAVSPYGLINDVNKVVNFFLDFKIMKYNSVNFHPLNNAYTINLKVENLIKFLKLNNILVKIIDFDNYIIIEDK